VKPDIPAELPQKEKTFDHIFKELLETLSPPCIIAFVNSTFKHNMPLNSAVESMRTESNIGSRTTADYILKITEPDGKVHYFHAEAQTTNDNRMVFRMVEYGIRFALDVARYNADNDDILIELFPAVVFYLKDNDSTPRLLNVTIKVPDGQELHYTIPAERMSDYTPEELLEQDKEPLFPFYMANFSGKDPEKFEEEWLAGCAKLNEFVKSGRILKADADRLLDAGRTVIRKARHPNEKEVFESMDMFEVVGVGIDWLEIKRQKDEAVAEAAAKATAKATAKAAAEASQKSLATALKAIAKGLSFEDAADLAGLPLEEVQRLAKVDVT
jgi:hypothetical protein